jgi:hypothetical protein
MQHVTYGPAILTGRTKRATLAGCSALWLYHHVSASPLHPGFLQAIFIQEHDDGCYSHMTLQNRGNAMLRLLHVCCRFMEVFFFPWIFIIKLYLTYQTLAVFQHGYPMRLLLLSRRRFMEVFFSSPGCCSSSPTCCTMCDLCSALNPMMLLHVCRRFMEVFFFPWLFIIKPYPAVHNTCSVLDV